MVTFRSCVWLVLAGAAWFGLSACSTPSINAIYSSDEGEVTTDDRVVGAWVDHPTKGKPTRYEVGKRGDDKANWYPLKVMGETPDKSGEFELRLVKLGAYTYADFFPARAERDRLGERLYLAAIPAHVIYPITIADDKVTLRPLDGRKVKALVEQSPKMTPHAIRDDLVILTGDVRQVQEFFRKVVETEDLFGEELKLTRAPAEPAASSAPVAVPDNTRSRTGGASPRPRRK